MRYWLYHHFSRHLGDDVMSIVGQSPYHPDSRDTDALGFPLTPVMATLSADSSRLFVMIVNGSWVRDVPARLRPTGFTAQACDAVLLRHDDLNAHPLLKHDAEFVHNLSVALAGEALSLNLPSHSIVFLTLSK
ncbi:MAG: hypothetical protein HQ464_13735 [Planctomycetes bacterium]|nr:hypothetical protein [Planctomycetota bacterium]